MKLTLILIALLGLLGACAPAAHTRPPEEPIVFEADYDTLFDATLQAITTSALPGPAGGRLRFRVAEAERESGLVTAVHGATPDAVFTASRRFGSPEVGTTFGLRATLPLGAVQPDVFVTAVIRPEQGGRASIVYSSVTRRGLESQTGNRFMARVLARLEARFGLPLN
jgi:hypothetical protein